MNKKKFRSYEDAKTFIQSLGLKNQKEWRGYSKSGSKPNDIPANPEQHYKKTGEWESFGDWLGSGNTRSKGFRSYKDAREFVHQLGLKNKKEWREYFNSGSKPNDIPTAPDQFYKKDWIGIGDWLGTGTIAPKNRKYKTFLEARKFVHQLGLKKQKEWYDVYCKSGKKPEDIPTNPDHFYKKTREWISWGDWLGTGIIASYLMEFRQFENAREFVQSLGLKNQKEWKEYLKSGKKPENIPSSPGSVYKNKGWISWGDWLGTGSIASQNRIFRTFEDARKIVHDLNIKDKDDWFIFCKSGTKSDDIPNGPAKTYKNKGWEGWGNWLGTYSISSIEKSKQYLSFTEAKIKSRELAKQYNIKNLSDWKKAVKDGKIPDNIPLDPTRIYSKKGKK